MRRQFLKTNTLSQLPSQMTVVGLSESESRSVMSDSLWLHGLYSSWSSLGQNTGMGSLSLLQGIFLTQRSNPGLPHCMLILYQLSHKGCPRTLKWSSALQADSLPTELSGKCSGFRHLINIRPETRRYLLVYSVMKAASLPLDE